MEELDEHIKIHYLTPENLAPHKSNTIFHHPFTMIVAGPTRSGKTTWVASLLENRRQQILPTPSRIIYCYRHWQTMYDELDKLIIDIEFSDELPTAETFSTFSDSLIILDDMMDDVVNSSEMMKVFTEASHHKNVSVIFMSQNIFHPGSRARTISLNTQYMVLFKNPRDRQQIKTLARQMYPDNWINFMERFNRATNKPYGKLIIDLRPNVLEENRFLGDENNKEDEMRKKSLTQMYSEKVKQQRDRLQFKRPYAVRAMDIKSKMDTLMKDTSLPDNLKSNRYNELLREYQFAMSKNEDDSTKEIMQHIIPLKDTVTADTTTTTTHESTESMPSTSATPKSSKYTPSFAERQLTLPYMGRGTGCPPIRSSALAPDRAR